MFFCNVFYIFSLVLTSGIVRVCFGNYRFQVLGQHTCVSDSILTCVTAVSSLCKYNYSETCVCVCVCVRSSAINDEMPQLILPIPQESMALTVARVNNALDPFELYIL